MMNGLLELFSLVSVELAMLAVAVFGYVLFNGIPALAKVSPGKFVKTIDDEKPTEEELIAQDLQKKLAEGDHRAVYKLWQRAKSFDMPSGVPLSSIVDSMQKLGKTSEGNPLRVPFCNGMQRVTLYWRCCQN